MATILSRKQQGNLLKATVRGLRCSFEGCCKLLFPRGKIILDFLAGRVAGGSAFARAVEVLHCYLICNILDAPMAAETLYVSQSAMHSAQES